jgi:imidazolonepropionase-like amidohydrolase
MDRLVLKNARLIDGTGAPPREGATVVVEGGRITEVRYGVLSEELDHAMLDRLEPHEREIVRKRYGLEGSRIYSRQELAAEMGVAPNQLRGVETRILLKLKRHGAEGSSQGSGEEDAQVIDLQEATLMPGLINAHCHVMMDAGPDPIAAMARTNLAQAVVKAMKRCEAMLKAGITTARDLGGYEWGELALRDAFAAGELRGPQLMCAGKVITMTGGHGWDIGLESDGPDAVRKSARINLKKGSDCLKFMATGGVLTPGVEPGATQLSEAEMRAGVEEARNVGKRTASHAQGTDGIKNALRAGIDTIEHGIFLDEECIEMMLKQGAVFVPTLAAPYRIVEAGEAKGIPAYALRKSLAVMDAHRRSFEWAAQAGVTIAAGNDGGTPFNPSDDLVTEMRLMVEYGMSVLGAIRAATLGSARALGLSEEVGTVQKGMWADLIVLEEDADPVADIGALGKVGMVMKRGVVV